LKSEPRPAGHDRRVRLEHCLQRVRAGLPSDRAAAADVLREAWARAENERVEIACGGGHGRTGTGLACLAVLDGVPHQEAVAYVRRHYAPPAVETPWQRRFISRFQ
jgi:protein-tyrosine phosphatase